MNSIEDIKQLLAGKKEDLRRRFRVKEIGVFGSFVRGEERPVSDIDILVDFEEPIGFFTFLELEERLTEILGHRVDLVSRKALKPNIGKRILAEVVPV